MSSNHKNTTLNPMDRSKIIIKTSVIGIIANAFLSVFKAVIGILTGSIAITLDAVNNLTDAAASAITIIGTKLAGKAPDRKHPFGYGRIEYLTASIIAVIILYAGITSFSESISLVINPKVPEYSIIPLVIVGVAVVVKIVLGRYVTSVGRKVNSDSLVNSGKDATLDSIISASTLVAALIFVGTGVSLEAYLGAIIALVIIKSGFDMLKETLSKILGERADAELAHAIKDTVCSFPKVTGAYDLFLNDYGPDTWQGSVHIEVPDTCTADELDQLIRDITIKVMTEHNVLLTAIGVYSVNTKDERAAKIRQEITNIALECQYVKQIHGFFIDENRKSIRFDAVVDFDAKDRSAVYEELARKVGEKYPDYQLQIALDIDLMES